jgi:hypothetical protein
VTGGCFPADYRRKKARMAQIYFPQIIAEKNADILHLNENA